MDKCINTKHPEFIKLAEQANINPLILKSKVGVWQEKNNSDDFPTLAELGIGQEAPIKSWADSNQSNVLYQLPQGREIEEFIASEKTIRDLAARMSDRIGIPIIFESDRSKKYKGKIENNTAHINLAYATLDTPVHEILAHPIIRAIRNGSFGKYIVDDYTKTFGKWVVREKNGSMFIGDVVQF